MHATLKTLTPLAAAVALALGPLAAPATAAPAVAHWTVIDVGTLGGDLSAAQGLNNAGQVTGIAYPPGNSLERAFRYDGGSMVDLGTLGGSFSGGVAINDAAQVTGYSRLAGDAVNRAFLYSGGSMVDLGTLGGSNSYGYAINGSGHVVGASQVLGDTAQRAFLYRSGSMTDLGTLGGSLSAGLGINAAGHVTGYATTAGDATTRAFVWRNGTMTDLGTLGGTLSLGYGINDAGQVTGYAYTAGDAAFRAFIHGAGGMTDLGTLGGRNSVGASLNAIGQVTGWSDDLASGTRRAFLYSQGAMTDVNTFNGVAGSGWLLYQGTGINDAGQLVGYGISPTGQTRGFLLTLDTTVWQGAPNASWDDAHNWSHGIAPNRNTAVFIEPLGSRTIVGPSTAVQAKSLTIGGDPADGNALATLRLGGGRITLTTQAYQAMQITANGVLTGQGTIAASSLAYGVVENFGRIVADDLSITGLAVNNYGTIEGDGRLAADYGISNISGTIRIARPGERLNLEGTLYNYARVDVTRGEIGVNGGLLNYGGQVGLLDGTLRSNYIFNDGRIDVTSGNSAVYGSVENFYSGRITVSGQGRATFWDTVNNYGELRVSAGAVATFFGDFYARTGGTLSGTGSKYYEAGYSIGNSPGVAIDEGSIAFGPDAVVQMEIGGLSPGNGDGFHDKLIVGGELTFDGTLTLASWAGFTAQAGQSFDLFDWGSVSGSFDLIDSSGLLLAAGTRLDTSRLYVDGSISVTAVPEPGTWALWAAGLAAGAGVARRRRVSTGAAL